MGYNLADLPLEGRERIEADKVAAYLAWQAQQGLLNAAQLAQQVEQQPESRRQHCINKLAEYQLALGCPRPAEG